MKYKKILITGKVQNVGFREFLIKESSMIGGIVGYAKNLKDGNIEVVASGEDEKIKKLVERCKKGPFLSSVKSVDVQDVEMDENYDSFVVRL